jgi:tRNA(His) guanylyltransferase
MMTTNGDSLGDRMKDYESVPKNRLVPHIPVLIRLDGKAFHSFTKPFERPYDPRFHECMWQMTSWLCGQIQGTRIAYVQSDEITLLLTQKTIFSSAWYDCQIQKMCSVAASLAGAKFLDVIRERCPNVIDKTSIPAFDARVWNLPVHEVCNAFIWRQQDATRNSILMLGQAHFSHKELNGKSCDEVQEMMMTQRDINWSACPVPQKRGVCIIKEQYEVFDSVNPPALRSRWVVDQNIPIFTQDRDYIEKHLVVEETGDSQ